MKILWCITGAGHFLRESVEELRNLSLAHEITCVLSNAGEEVARAYGMLPEIRKSSKNVISEKQQEYSTPISGSSRHDVVVVAPCTANTVAKIVHGIADSTVSNIVSQFIKRRTPVIILPTDYKKKIKTELPSGKKVTVHCRNVDLMNVGKLKKIGGIKIITTPEMIPSALKRYVICSL